MSECLPCLTLVTGDNSADTAKVLSSKAREVRQRVDCPAHVTINSLLVNNQTAWCLFDRCVCLCQITSGKDLVRPSP